MSYTAEQVILDELDMYGPCSRGQLVRAVFHQASGIELVNQAMRAVQRAITDQAIHACSEYEPDEAFVPGSRAACGSCRNAFSPEEAAAWVDLAAYVHGEMHAPSKARAVAAARAVLAWVEVRS